jgi:hypothetical protein
MGKPQVSKTESLKASYITPRILTLKVNPSFASSPDLEPGTELAPDRSPGRDAGRRFNVTRSSLKK